MLLCDLVNVSTITPSTPRATRLFTFKKGQKKLAAMLIASSTVKAMVKKTVAAMEKGAHS